MNFLNVEFLVDTSSNIKGNVFIRSKMSNRKHKERGSMANVRKQWELVSMTNK